LKKHFPLLFISLFALHCERGWLREILYPTGEGCTESDACNYNPEAKEEDDSCIDPLGCDNWCPGDKSEVKELDCAGVCGGGLFIDCRGTCGPLEFDECGFCGGDNGTCTDCNGVVNGDAFIDPHYNIDICTTNECVGGNTGFAACTYDCAAIWGGTGQLDECGVCGDNNGTCTDCNGVVNGEAYLDGCSSCVGGDTGKDACEYDCDGVPDGTAIWDECAECVPIDDTSCVWGCDGEWKNDGNHLLFDDCDVCGGNNSICSDCLGTPNGVAELDICGVCDGDGSSCYGCTDPDACNFNSTATIFDNSCWYPNVGCECTDGHAAELDECEFCGGNNGTCTDCNGVVNGEAYLDGCSICVGGDTGKDACEYDCAGVPGGTAILDECGVCNGEGMAVDACDCDGNVDLGCGCGEVGPSGCDNICGSILEHDECGVCGGNGIDAGSCDCAGNVEDCAGECGGSAVIDECGVCDGNVSTCAAPIEFEYNQSSQLAFYYFISVNINGQPVEPDDWVGVFNGDICVGSRKWDTSTCGGGVCDAPAMGDDGNDFTEGYMQTGDIPTFKIYDTSANTYYDAIASEDIPFQGYNMEIINNLNVYTDCDGILGGSAYIDECGDCDSVPSNDCSLNNMPNWEDTPGAYQFTSTIGGGIVIYDGDSLFANVGDIFAAFDTGGNVRGVSIQLSPPFGPYVGEIVYEMQMRSNNSGDLLTFKYYDASEDIVFDIVETYEFIINDILGDVINPVFYNIASP